MAVNVNWGSGPSTVLGAVRAMPNPNDYRDAMEYSRYPYDNQRPDDALRRMFLDVLSEQESNFKRSHKLFMEEIHLMSEELIEVKNELGGVREENEELKAMLERIMEKLGVSHD